MSGLQKNMSVPQGVVMAICTLVGSGLLGLPGLAIEVGGEHASALGWLLSVLISMPLVVIFMQLSLQVQSAGGVATFAGMALGDWAETAVGFVLAVTFTFGMPLGIYMGGMYLQEIFALPHNYLLWVVLAILAVSIAVNYFGLKPAGWLNTLAVASLLALIGLIMLAHWAFLPAGLAAYGNAFTALQMGDVSFNSLWGVCAVLFWAFLGWENMSFGSEEIAGENDQSTKTAIKKIYLWAFIAVSAIYLSLAVLTAGAVASGLSVGGVTGLLALLEGSPFEGLAYGLIVFVILANVNAWVYACSRSLYASGKAGILPTYLGRVSDSGVPRASLLTMLAALSVICYLVFADVLPLEQGLALTNQNFIVVYVLSIICYLKINTGWFARLIGFLALASCGFLMIGFGWFVFIPLVLMLLGWLVHRFKRVS